ncbi:hypothetical protein ACIGXA_26125 [Streptomyces fildesensis]|uniref:Enoyl reductase n=1 Tax=Streptomyces fildesensis TaxID=375757 RepID=A0ABW8CC24_9ACTN
MRVSAVLALGVSMALPATAAHADDRGGNGSVTTVQQGDTDSDKGTISATSGVRFDKADNGKGSSTGPLTPVGTWRPPACWNAPKYSPAQLKAEDEPTWAQQSVGADWATQRRDYYVNGHPYTDFNAANADKGSWWGWYIDKAQIGDPASLSCMGQEFWVDKGDPPPPEKKNAVTPEILAQLAYAAILIPQGTANTSPAGAQTVNLPTWVWLDGKQFHPVSVTAYVPGYGITATTTARPVSVHLDPGTPDATVFPASGDCPMDAGGQVGTPYTAGGKGGPPCGVTYLRSTNTTGPYHLKATVTWHISWTGTGQPTPKDLPEGTFGSPQDVTVREIQTINR